MKKLLKGIEERQTKNGTVYRVRLQYNKKIYRATRDSLEEAISWKKKTLSKLESGEQIGKEAPPGDMTLVDATHKFIMEIGTNKSISSVNSYNWARAQLLKYFGEKTLLSSITEARVNKYVNHRQNIDLVGASKISQELSFIRMVYEAVRFWGVDLPSPERNISRPRKPNLSREDRLERVITEHEMVPLLEKVRSGYIHKYTTEEAYNRRFKQRNETLYLYLLFLLFSGMRPTEAALMRWNRPHLSLLKQAKKKPQHIGYYNPARNGFSRVGTKTETRFVPAHPVVKNIIENITRSGEFIFLPDSHGQKTTPYKYFRSAFETARKNTVLKDGSRLRQDIDFYSFRHTARSRMANCGVQDSAAEIIIGHEDNKMRKTYIHYDDNDLVREIAKLDYPWLKPLTT